jgi:hypothetical protein
VSIQQNNQVLEESLGGHSKQAKHKAYHRAMDKVMQWLGIEVVDHNGKNAIPMVHCITNKKPYMVVERTPR